MKRQQSKWELKPLNGSLHLSFIFIFCFYWQMGVYAQSNLSFDSHSHQLNANGSYQDFSIPASAYKYLYLEARGADGGHRWTTWYHRQGGAGATVAATFAIGTDNNQLAPGGTIRFVIGKGGESASSDAVAGSGGGGGTGILYLPPNVASNIAGNWKLLMVAGGGGGAAGDCCALKTSGQAGRIGDPGDGKTKDGGGLFEVKNDYKGRGGVAYHPLPEGGQGGKFSEMTLTSTPSNDGGFGFGGGGAGCSGCTAGNAGGGGGYSGGGEGSVDFDPIGGEGGTSYINEPYAASGSIAKKDNGHAENPNDGYAAYRAAAVPVPPQAKQIRLSTHIDKCIDLLYGNTDNGATVGIWDCGTNSPHQYWIYDGNFIRYAMNLNKCLDLAGGNTSNGAKIEIWDCQINNENTPHQQWVLDPGTGHFQLKANPSKCLDLNAGILDNGNKIQLWDCQTNNANQAWLPAKKIILASQPNKCIDQLYGNTDNGATVGIWNCGANSPHQFWVYDRNFIRYGADLNKCLDLANGDTSDGAKIQIWDCQINNENTPHQQWVLEPGTGKIRLKADPSKCLDLYGGYVDNDNGNWLWIWDCMTYAVNQTWIVE